MGKKQKKVLIVQDGKLGSETYEDLVSHYKRWFDEEKLPGDKESTEKISAAIVDVVKSVDDVEKKILNDNFDIVILVSVDKINFAKKLRNKFKRIKVFVLVGIEPEGEPYIIHKFMFGRESVRDLLSI